MTSREAAIRREEALAYQAAYDQRIASGTAGGVQEAAEALVEVLGQYPQLIAQVKAVAPVEWTRLLEVLKGNQL